MQFFKDFISNWSGTILPADIYGSCLIIKILFVSFVQRKKDLLHIWYYNQGQFDKPAKYNWHYEI